MVKKLVSLVIPTFNEEANLQELFRVIDQSMPSQYAFECILVDDGSNDHTLEVIKKLAKNNSAVKYLSFTRNFGHQYALKAGIDYALGEAVISLDADLQHPPKLIPVMLKAWEQGNKIVYTKRIREFNRSWLKNMTSQFFYRLINWLSETKIDPGSADFRLLDREVVNFIKASKESTLFLRGLVSWSGYKSFAIEYRSNSRFKGKSKYSVSKMLALAIDAITSFSIVPLRLAIILGLMMALLSGIYGVYALIAWVNGKNIVLGWASMIISVLFIGGIQLTILGIVGEYIGKIFMETKNRPLYIIKEKKI